METRGAPKPGAETAEVVKAGSSLPIVVPLVRSRKIVAVPARHRVVAELFRYHPTPTSAPPIHRIRRPEELQSLGHTTVTREKIIKDCSVECEKPPVSAYRHRRATVK
ncbi:MAG: hypothetical protein VYA49_03960 [Planctomycetota bacterium]|nr:hypothetical protein [Planctomycetota bacterium]